MNPSLSESVVARAYERDAAAAAAEYGAQFRTDIESFVNREIVEACVAHGVYERPPRNGVRYVAFTDPSGGSKDSFTLAIAHRDGDHQVLDLLREVRPPFSPEGVCDEFATVLMTYGIKSVTGDRYAGEWPREQFAKRNITYEVSERPKSDIYLNTLPLLNSRRIALLDNQRLIAQLCGLERRTSRAGRDSIDHAPNSHDDLANAAAGALLLAAQPQQRIRQFACHMAYGPGSSQELDPKTGHRLDRSHERLSDRLSWVITDAHGNELSRTKAHETNDGSWLQKLQRN